MSSYEDESEGAADQEASYEKPLIEDTHVAEEPVAEEVRVPDENEDQAADGQDGGDHLAPPPPIPVVFQVESNSQFDYTDVESERNSSRIWKIPLSPQKTNYKTGYLRIYGSVTATPQRGTGSVEFVVTVSDRSIDGNTMRQSVVIDGDGTENFAFVFVARWNTEYFVNFKSHLEFSHRLRGTVSATMSSC